MSFLYIHIFKGVIENLAVKYVAYVANFGCMPTSIWGRFSKYML